MLMADTTGDVVVVRQNLVQQAAVQLNAQLRGATENVHIFLDGGLDGGVPINLALLEKETRGWA